MRRAMLFSLMLVILCVIHPFAAATDTIHLVKDINTVQASSFPYFGPAMGGKAFFMASDGIHGNELWTSDGTPAGTRLVKDVTPGGPSHVENFLAVGSFVFFTVQDGTSAGLWRSDGTAAGTVQLLTGKEIWPDYGGVAFDYSSAPIMAAIGNTVYFFTTSLFSDKCFLWKADTIQAHGSLVKQFVSPPVSSGTSPNLQAFKGNLYFLLDDSSGHGALWRCDGTEAGTMLLKQVSNNSLNDFLNDSYYRFKITPDRFFFTAQDLWASDGTVDGTILCVSSTMSHLWDKNTDSCVFYISSNSGGQTYDLVRCDGTAAGTYVLNSWPWADLDNTFPGQLSFLPVGTLNNVVYFLVPLMNSGLELWKTDGSVQGTVRVTVTIPNDLYGMSSIEDYVFLNRYCSNNLLFFLLPSAPYGVGLWRSDGTAARTFALKTNVTPGLDQSGSFGMIPCGSQVLFPVFDFASLPNPPFELWRTDGSVAGTSKAGQFSSFGGSDYELPLSGVGVGSTGLFAADDGVHGMELWKSDGTPQGTALLKDIRPGTGDAQIGNIVGLDGMTYFTADNGKPTIGESIKIWRTDGIEFHTALLNDTNTPYYWPDQLFPMGGGICFLALINVSGQSKLSLCWSSGADNSATVLKDLDTWQGSTSAKTLNGLGFLVGPNGSGYSLWTTDGTVDGTQLVAQGSGIPDLDSLVSLNGQVFYADWHNLCRVTPSFSVVKTISSSKSIYAQSFTVYSGRLFFASYDGNGQPALWSSDGTADGTMVVTTVGNWGQDVHFSVANGTLYFVASDDAHGAELWRSDGTAAGTGILLDINPGPAGSNPTNFAVIKNELFFQADDGVHGPELWLTYGQPETTVIVKDIAPGPAGSNPRFLTPYNGHLVFFADDGIHGEEMWQSNGTADGTFLAHEFVPGPDPCAPSQPIMVGDKLYFALDDGIHGSELWVYEPDAPALSIVNSHGSWYQVGEPLDLNVQESGIIGATYQWFKDGVELTGETTDTYHIDAIEPSDSGTYICVVTESGDAGPFMADPVQVIVVAGKVPVSNAFSIVLTIVLILLARLFLMRKREKSAASESR